MSNRTDFAIGFFWTAGMISLAVVSADAKTLPASITPPDEGPVICVCDTEGRAMCHFPDDGVWQVLPRSMCVGKQPGDDPMEEKDDG